MKKLILLLVLGLTGLLQAQSYIPLVNNISPLPMFNGYEIRIAETADHFRYAPLLVKQDGKPIIGLMFGASTPSQIAKAFVLQCAVLKDVKVVNVCTGSEDVNKWLSLSGRGWTNVKTQLAALNYSYHDVQFIVMCNDDLKDQSVLFPAAPMSLANKQLDLIKLCKSQFPNLKLVTLESRLCEYQIIDNKFKTPTGYLTCWANRFTVEATFSTGHLLDGVWITDHDFNFWTNGEQVRSDGFQFLFSYYTSVGNVHLNTANVGDDICAAHGFNNMKRYPFFK